MDYVFDFNETVAYAKSLTKPENRYALDLENRLMLDLLQPNHGETVVDIGCGTGSSILPFLEIGVQATGLDPSPYMLDIALKNLGHRVDLYRGFAHDLPFDDNSFNYACLNTTLEFVDNPQKALEEACRVAKDRLFIGVLNRFAIKGVQRRVEGMFTETIYNHARFFSIWELKKIIRQILGDVPIAWRTVCQLPSPPGKMLEKIEQSTLVQRSPTGAYVGIGVTLVPRFRTRPLALKHGAKQTTEIVTG